MKSVGLSLNLHKCELWGPGAEAWQGPPVKIIPWTPKHGVTILGVPINFPGSTAYSESFWHGLMNTLQAATARVTSQLDPQCAHHLLRKCLDACKVTHLLRATDTYNSLDLGICDEAIWGAFEDLLGCGLNIWQRTQTALPIGVGGCGLRIPSRIRPAARIAALASYYSGGAARVGIPDEVRNPRATWIMPVLQELGALTLTPLRPGLAKLTAWPGRKRPIASRSGGRRPLEKRSCP